jgi:hypothetical protein
MATLPHLSRFRLIAPGPRPPFPTVRPLNREELVMNGKLLDAGLVVVWLGAFLIVAMAHPGLANFLIAWLGAVTLGWYNILVRHDPKTDALRGPWQRRATTPNNPDVA